MNNMIKKIACCLICATCLTIAKAQNVRLTFDMAQRGKPVAEDLFGIFFEEINHGGEGGLYGEAVVNRSFDDDYGSFYGWTSQDADCSLIQTNLLNQAQRNACKVVYKSNAGWLRNSGFGGIKLVRNNSYKVSFWVRTDGDEFDGNITARLVDASSGTTYGIATFQGPFNQEWKKCMANIMPTANINNGAIQLQVSKATTLVFDMVSCFPPTFKNRENGMRKDLGQMLADLKPRFMRFPGGCYVEGRTGWDREPNNSTRWEWKKTIGPVEERPGHRNQQWGYWVSDGQGYHEFLQFCEDIGAAPMFVCNVGLGHGWIQDYRNIGEYVQEVIDAIEYANGDSTTVWGRKRAQNGHPEPFNLKYVEIGNENCNFDFNSNSDQSDHYFERYIQFYNAIKAKYPDVITIGNVEAWATDNPSWRSNYPIELVDEHYYRDANFYINNYEKYNNYSRAGAGIYIGEYAANVGGGNGNLNNALAEAIFMQGMENNSDIVKMASFAPIFINETYGGWNYDIIRFNHQAAYGIPSYYVQKMFGQNQGKTILKWTEKDNVPQLSVGNRQIGVGTWLTTANFSDVKMTDPEGNVIFAQEDYNSSVWTRGTGTWAYVNGTIRQINATTEGATYMCNLQLPNENYDLSLKATKTSGSEGFLVVFNYKDAQNYTWWNIGGWGNSAMGIENAIGGVRTTISRKDGKLETNHTYDILVKKRGANVKCYMDGELIHDVDIPAGYAKGVYTSAALDEKNNTAIIKLTNPNPASIPLTIEINNGTPVDVSAEVLTSTFSTDENTMGNPTYVVPKTSNAAKIEGGDVVYDVPAYSFNVLKVTLSDMVQPETKPELPMPDVEYSFESGQPVSDDLRFRGTLLSGAVIQEMTDGNHVLYSGGIGSRGFMNLGTEMPKSVFNDVSNYTISMDVLNRADNNLGAFTWALAITNETNQYFGLINAAGNRDWYAEVKNGSAQSVSTGSTMRTSVWHNITFVQDNGVGKIYIDGRKYRETSVNILIKSFVNNISGCYIARSPFTADAYMENAYFDNLRIFGKALTDEQICVIADQTESMSDDENLQLNMPNQFADLLAQAKTVEKYAEDMKLTEALNHAQNVSLGSNATVLQKEMESLKETLYDYQDSQMRLMQMGEKANLSFLIGNSIFAQQTLRWNGTDFTAVADETAEQFSRYFDNWQVINQLQPGKYLLIVDAFYRAGNIENAYDKWKNNYDECRNAELYVENMNDDDMKLSALIPSIYDAKEYTYSPYTFPDNLAQASNALNKEDTPYLTAIEFELNEQSDVRIGIRNNNVLQFDWTAFDNFRLFFMGTATGIVDIDTSNDADKTNERQQVFDVTGRLVTNTPVPGIYIINGKKIMIK